jgi:hypothetical protein
MVSLPILVRNLKNPIGEIAFALARSQAVGGSQFTRVRARICEPSISCERGPRGLPAAN